MAQFTEILIRHVFTWSLYTCFKYYWYHPVWTGSTKSNRKIDDFL